MKHRLTPGGSLGYVDEAGDVIVVRPGDVLIPPGHLLEAHPERFEPLEGPSVDANDPANQGVLGTPLPADFPGKESLEAAGLGVLELLEAFLADKSEAEQLAALDALKGIGEATARGILEALATASNPT